MLGWVALVAPFFMVYQTLIIPTLSKMLEEFSIETPLSLSLVARHGAVGSILGTLVPLMILAVFGATLLVWISPTLAQQPPFRWFCHAYFRSLGWIAFARVSKHTDQPVQALRQTSELVPVGYLSTRFEQAATNVESGQPLVDAMASAQLIPRQHLASFSSQLDTSGLAWATEQLAKYDVDRMLYRYSIVIQWTLVLITLLFAAFVAMFAIGMLQTLTIMIYEVGVSSYTNP
jgi:type II secretory pathway component PulF